MRTTADGWWIVERGWAGATVAILAGGPSLDLAQAQACRCGVKVIAVNSAWRLRPDADLLLFYDERFWKDEAADIAAGFRGDLVTMGNDHLVLPPGTRRLLNEGVEGWPSVPWALRAGGNVGYGAIILAAMLGAARVVLLGFDMRAVGPDGRTATQEDLAAGAYETHWHDRRRNVRSPGSYAKWRPRFEALVEPLASLGCAVVNATPGSALDTFPRDSLREALRCPPPSA